MLLNLDVQRMTTLAEKWGGVPRALLRFLRHGLTDAAIELRYKGPASKAVEKCQEVLSAIEVNSFRDDAPSQFYFCRPYNDAETGVERTLFGVSVPTRTLRRLLGEALQKQDNFLKLDFFRALCQPRLDSSSRWLHLRKLVPRLLFCGKTYTVPLARGLKWCLLAIAYRNEAH